MPINNMKDMVRYLESKDPCTEVCVLTIDMDDVRVVASYMAVELTDSEVRAIVQNMAEQTNYHEYVSEYISEAISGYLQDKETDV